MKQGRRTFLIGASMVLVILLLAGCLPGKQSPISFNCAPLGKLQSILPSPGKPGQSSAAATGGKTRSHPPVRTGDVTTGPKTQLASQSIGPSGGMISISKPGDALDGFVLDVPEQSYSGSRTFKISSAPITKQTFGSDINPLSPMITVDNGGGYSDEVMYIRVPVNVPEGSFAMGFIYDEKTRQLEGLPMVGSDAGSVTLATMHFSNFFVSVIEKALLKKDIDSGFRPGIDDWQFVNRGSYIAPGGHCEGQALTAMWYYCTQPDGKDRCLYGRYDNNGETPATPDLWVDDSLGYRFCSVIQEEKRVHNGFWDNLSGVGWKKVNAGWQRINVPGISDQMAYNLFAYSMQATGEPQEVGIRSNAGGGHAMIVYRVTGNNLYIADPNYPGNTERRILFSTADGKFNPYNSGANKEEIDAGHGKAYEKIQYCGKSAVVPWDVIAAHWAEFKNKTVGNDKFPGYTIKYKDARGDYQELKDGYVSPVKLIDLVSDGMDINEASIKVYRDGAQLGFDNDGNFELVPGNNRLGFYISGEANNKRKYVDFKYINVVYGEASSDRLKELQKMKFAYAANTIEVTRSCTGIKTGKTETSVINDRYEQFGNGTSYAIPITWSGAAFSGKFKVNQSDETYEISGTVSPDGNTVTSLTCLHRWNFGASELVQTFANIPVTWFKEQDGSWRYMGSELRGTGVGQCIRSLSLKEAPAGDWKCTHLAPKANEKSFVNVVFLKAPH